MPEPQITPVKPKMLPTSEELKTMIKADRKSREDRAIQRIQQILAEERCLMRPVITLSEQGYATRVEIAAQD